MLMDYETAAVTDPLELLSKERLPVLIFTALDKGTLTDRHKKIIILRYGLDGEKPKSLQKVADLFGLSRERIRQLEREAFRKLKQSKELQLGYAFDIEKQKRLQKKKNRERQAMLVELDDAFRYLRAGWRIDQISFMTGVPTKELEKWFYRNEDSEK
jgi:DNA-binding CsgD family transcriptional regulator